MIRRPQFKRYMRYEIVPSEGVFLFFNQGVTLLKGDLYVRLAPFLDGQHTADEIVGHLEDQLPVAELYYALGRLEEKGYIAEATALPLAEAAWWDVLGLDPDQTAACLQQTSLSVVAFGQVDPTPFCAALTAAGMPVGSDGQRYIVLTDDYQQPALADFNREALARRRPWLLFKPFGPEFWLGPIFVPGQTGCWACLVQRLQAHRKIEGYLQKKKSLSGPVTVAPITPPSQQQIAFGLAVQEVAGWVAGDEHSRLIGQVISLNLLTLAQRGHTLVRRPQCSHCGDPTPAAMTFPLTLQARPKVFTSDGGHRQCWPTETFDRFKHHLSPITGIVSDLQPTWLGPEQTDLVKSYSADHNFVYIDDELYFLRRTLRSYSGGKGRSDIQAKTSALCESIERYCGVFVGSEARHRASLSELADAAVQPYDLLLFSQAQYRNRVEWNKKNTRHHQVPHSFDEAAVIDWSPVWSLTHQQTRYVPTAYAYYGYPLPEARRFTSSDSNGCAAGNSLEEAILQGFLELVERDGVALWWYNRLNRPAVDLASFDEPYFQQLLAYYQAVQRDLWVLDLTTDLTIPTFAAVSRRNNQAEEAILLGFGSHLEARIAIMRALTEVNQGLPVVAAGPAQSGRRYPYDDPDAINWWQTATIANQPYLVPAEGSPRQTAADYPHLWSDDLAEDVRICVRLAAAQGLETLVLDQTRPDIGLPVARVIVPGLRHFWARFAPGRLYEVPVRLGWLSAAQSETALNPRFMFL